MIGALAVLLVASALPRITSVPVGMRVTTPTFDGVIIGGEGSTPKDFWLPSPADVVAAEAALRVAVAGNRFAQTRLATELQRYKRQYFGTKEAGKKFIKFWGIHPDALQGSRQDSWVKSILTIAGGGDLFFRATYDVRDRKITELNINGPK